MSNQSIPYVPPELVEYLNKINPLRAPQKGDSLEDLMWYGGQRSIIDKLTQVVKDQKPRNR